MEKRNRFAKMCVLFMVTVLTLAALAACGSSDSKTSDPRKKTNEKDASKDESSKKDKGEGKNAKLKRGLEKNEDGLYIINSAEDLLLYRDLLELEMQEDFDSTGHSTDATSGAVLMADIDMSAVCGKDIGTWRPIGAQCVMEKDRSGLSVYPDGSLYQSLFDGNGHTISHLYVEEEYGAGLFYCLNETEICNLTFTDSMLSSVKGEVGTVAATMLDGIAHDITIGSGVQVRSENEKHYVGGVVGTAYKWNSSATFERCVNHAVVSGGSFTGGIAGYCKGEVNFIECLNYGEVIGGSYTGGIVGNTQSDSYFRGLIMGCINYGKVSMKEDGTDRGGVGGIAGYNGGRVKYCVNAGIVDGGSRISWDICHTDHDNGAAFSCINIGEVIGSSPSMTTESRYSKGCASLAAGDPSLTDGSLVRRLNEEAGGAFWVQGEEFPIWSGLNE